MELHHHHHHHRQNTAHFHHPTQLPYVLFYPVLPSFAAPGRHSPVLFGGFRFFRSVIKRRLACWIQNPTVRCPSRASQWERHAVGMNAYGFICLCHFQGPSSPAPAYNCGHSSCQVEKLCHICAIFISVCSCRLQLFTLISSASVNIFVTPA